MFRSLAYTWILPVALAATGCSNGGAAMAPVPPDPSSYANVSAFVTTHLLLDLTANFDARTLSGAAVLTLDRRNGTATELVLDTRDLNISKVEAATGDGTFAPAAFTLDAATPAFGSALRITRPAGADHVRVTYTTSPNAKGLQWLTPAQTAGRAHPFMFSQ